jgi:hypothetical protein
MGEISPLVEAPEEAKMAKAAHGRGKKVQASTENSPTPMSDDFRWWKFRNKQIWPRLIKATAERSKHRPKIHPPQ